MMKKMILVWLSLFLVGTMLAGCGQVAAKLDEVFPEGTVTTTVTETELPLPERERRTYTVLLAVRAREPEQITTLSLLTFDTEDKSVYWWMLPTNLFVHVEETTLAGVFSTAYRQEIEQEGISQMEATRAGMLAMKELVEKGFQIPIDYYVSLDPTQLVSLVNGSLEGVPMTITEPIGGLGIGEANLNGNDAVNFIAYKGYSDSSEERMVARRMFAAALWLRASKVITSENLTEHVTQLRTKMTTDIPFGQGEDIFFWRRFLQADASAVQITQISAQGIYYNGTSCQVINRENTFRQLNEQLGVYQEPLLDEQFDPNALLVDNSYPLVRTVYLSTSPFPQLYTMQELDPSYQPEEEEETVQAQDEPNE